MHALFICFKGGKLALSVRPTSPLDSLVGILDAEVVEECKISGSENLSITLRWCNTRHGKRLTFVVARVDTLTSFGGALGPSCAFSCSSSSLSLMSKFSASSSTSIHPSDSDSSEESDSTSHPCQAVSSSSSISFMDTPSSSRSFCR